MAIKVKTGQMGFPFPLGKILPGALFAAESVPLTQNIIPCDNDGETPDYQFNGIFIQADMNNDDVIYVCSNADAPDLTGYTNVLAELGAGASFPRFKEWANNRDLSKLFIGAVNDTDFVIVSIDQF